MPILSQIFDRYAIFKTSIDLIYNFGQYTILRFLFH